MSEENKDNKDVIYEDNISHGRKIVSSDLQSDILSFRSIICALKKYNSIGDTFASRDFDGGDEDSDEDAVKTCANPFPRLINMQSVGYYGEGEPKSLKDLNRNGCSDPCSIFFHLVEMRKKDENGNPVFQSLKFWGGTCDFHFPCFKWLPHLKIWEAESFGSKEYFWFKEPFRYTDDDEPDKPIRTDLDEMTPEKLTEELRITDVEGWY